MLSLSLNYSLCVSVSYVYVWVYVCRAQSICDDTSSELQRMAAIDRRDINSQNSFRGRGALSRYSNL